MADKSDLAPAYLIFGTDSPKVRLAVSRFKRRVIQQSGSDLSLTVVDARTLRGAEVVDLLQTGSFVLGRRAVVVEAADTWKVAERNAIAGYLADPYPETTVVLTGESISRKEALGKVVMQLGVVLQYDLPKKRELADWVQELGKSMRIKVPVAEARHLLHVVGEDPLQLEAELRKLADYAGASPANDVVEIQRADIDAVCSPGLEAQIWDLTDAVGHRDGPAAFRVLEELFAMGGAPRRPGGAPSGDPARSIFVALSRHIDLLRRAHELAPRVSDADAGTALQIHKFRAQKLLEQRKTFGHKAVAKAMVVLAEADAALVGGSQLEPELVLERALVRLVS
jgi:DNA polymerase III subunit delta